MVYAEVGDARVLGRAFVAWIADGREPDAQRHRFISCQCRQNIASVLWCHLMTKHKNEPKQSIYFDTNVIVGYFKKGDEREHSKDVIEKAATMIKNPDIMVKIPIISLGECMNWLFNSNNGGIVENLQMLIEVKLNANTPPPDEESYKIAFELMMADNHMKPTDALIVAQALADRTSEWLITTDSKLLDNKIIVDRIYDDAKSNLKISDRFTGCSAGKKTLDDVCFS